MRIQNSSKYLHTLLGIFLVCLLPIILKGWLAGFPPYLDSFDQKPPATFLLYAATFKYFGASIITIRCLALFYTALIVFTLFALGSILFHPGIGLLTAFYATILLADPALLGHTANTELFMILPLSVSFGATILAIKKNNI